jgi:polysaccharide export outer membrane protein
MFENYKPTSLYLILSGCLFLSACAATGDGPITDEASLAYYNDDEREASLALESSTQESPTNTKKRVKNTAPPERNGTFAVDDYRIGPDDVILVSVWRNPELTVTVPVRPDGKVSLPLIGDVVVGGHTPTQVARNIEKKLKGFIRSPNVAVILTALNSHEFLSRVRITGAVNNPQSIPYRQGMTVLDAVLVAGGVNQFAAPNRSKLYRKTKRGTKVFDIELDDILTEGILSTNLDVRPGDIITVPERLF